MYPHNVNRIPGEQRACLFMIRGITITESRIKLLKILRKYVGKISYFWVVEPHTQNETGYPHFHLAVFANIDNNIRDSNGEGMEDKLQSACIRRNGKQAATHTDLILHK